MNGLKRLIRDEPVLLADAVRMTLLAVVLIGLNLSDEAVLGIVAAVGAILTVANRAMVTPVANVAEQVAEQTPTSPLDLSGEEFATLVELRRERDRLIRQRPPS